MSDSNLAVYADYVCPFCYLGRASLRQFLADAADPPTVEWRVFDLRGHRRDADGEVDHGVDDGKDEAYFAEVRENVRRLQERYGVEMAMDVEREVDSWNAQQVALAVREHHPGRFEAFHDGVFDALWRDGRDIGDPAVLADIAERVGLDREVVSETLADESAERRLREAFERTRRAGITGVPTFVYGERVARGAVPPEQLRRLVGTRATR